MMEEKIKEKKISKIILFCIDRRKTLAIKTIQKPIFGNPSRKNKIRSGTTTLFGDFNLLRVCVFPGSTRKNGLEFPALTTPLVNSFIYMSILITVAPNESLGYKLFNGI